MPIYEYRCTRCGEKFDVRQTIGEDGSKVTCPKCQAGNPQKLLSTFFSTNSSESSDISCPTCSSGVCGLPPM
ncbi:MAG: zinc ribbon domain-containing protein [Dehalococcoidia bacterium]